MERPARHGRVQARRQLRDRLGTLPDGQIGRAGGRDARRQGLLQLWPQLGRIRHRHDDPWKDGKSLESTYCGKEDGRVTGQWRITRDSGRRPSPPSPCRSPADGTRTWARRVFEQTGTDVTAKVTFVNGHTARVKGDLHGRTLDFTYRLGQVARRRGAGDPVRRRRDHVGHLRGRGQRQRRRVDPGSAGARAVRPAEPARCRLADGFMSDGWLGSSRRRAPSGNHWGLTSFDPSHPEMTI